MPVTLDSTIAGAAANSYVDVTEMAAFVNDRIQGAAELAWVALAADDQKRYLIAAARQLDSAHRWLGGRVTDLASTTPAQALEFPRFSLVTRSGIENLSGTYVLDARVKRAQMFQALHLNWITIGGAPPPPGGSVRAQLQAEGVRAISIGNTSENYEGVATPLCLAAENELRPLIRKSNS